MNKVLVMLIAITAMVGCGGGGNGGGATDPNSGVHYDHNEVAQMFVDALNATGSYTVALAKDSTEQYNYIVIYDADYRSYDAVYIGDYKPGMDVLDYMSRTAIFYDLEFYPGYYEYVPYDRYSSTCNCYYTDWQTVWREDKFYDRFNGVTFEKSTESSKDLSKFAALAEEEVINGRAESVSEKFGLEVGRAKEVVRLAIAWQKAGGKDLTDRDQDAFSQELLGFSITAAKSAMKAKAEGNSEPIEELIEKAAKANNTSVDHINDLIEQNFAN